MLDQKEKPKTFFKHIRSALKEGFWLLI